MITYLTFCIFAKNYPLESEKIDLILISSPWNFSNWLDESALLRGTKFVRRLQISELTCFTCFLVAMVWLIIAVKQESLFQGSKTMDAILDKLIFASPFSLLTHSLIHIKSFKELQIDSSVH